MSMPITKLEASVDVSKVEAGWLVTTKITARDGREVHSRISDPVEHEDAYYLVRGDLGALERLAVPAGLTAAASELVTWWETDRFRVVYHRYHSEKAEEFPTLERAWCFVTSGEDYGEMAAEEIQDIDGKTLYRHVRSGEWERVAEAVPPIEEFSTEA